jgi:hypothetical protein
VSIDKQASYVYLSAKHRVTETNNDGGLANIQLVFGKIVNSGVACMY